MPIIAQNIQIYTIQGVKSEMRLYLDEHDGIAMIPCPHCERPLLLGIERRGRWAVRYDHDLHLQPGRAAMLVCPGLDCEYVERAQGARSQANGRM